MKTLLKLTPAALLMAASFSAQALTPGSGTWVKETATYGSPNLQNVYVYVPSNTAPATIGSGRALMISLHGCSMTATNVINQGYNWETTAEQYGMVVVAPTVPSGTTSTRTVSGCWDWFGSSHTRTNRDMIPLKAMIDAIKTRSGLDIDPNQIYFTGLSSGGGETIVAGCMLPDYFAAIGINAGPALGSSSSQIYSDPAVTAANVKSYCQAAATSSYTSYFATQIASAVYGSSDYIVKPSHNVRNLEGLAQVYGMSYSNPTTSSISGGGTAKTYTDGNGKQRLVDISVSGMSHAWPAGSGGSGGGTYVSYSYINYPAWFTAWAFANNLRVSGGTTTTTTAATTTTTAAGTTTTSAATTTTTAATTTTTAATTTTTTTTTAGACYNTSNYAHVQAGRAYASGGYAYANGSNTKLGLNNTFYTSKLRQTGTNYYVVDSTCP